MFGASKGALDGGLDIPHSEKRLSGFDEDKSLDPKTYRIYILGGHDGDYMTAGVEAEDLANMYTKVHAAIRADPIIQMTEKKAPAEPKRWKTKKLTYDECQAALVQHLNAISEVEE